MSPSDPNHRYPLMEGSADSLRAASGRPLPQITLAAAAAGELTGADLKIHEDTLRAQAGIAREAGYPQLAENLTRAAELTAVPNAELLRMYELVRPGRATEAELQSLADTLETQYQAPHNAALVREAATVYRQRGLLRREAGR